MKRWAFSLLGLSVALPAQALDLMAPIADSITAMEYERANSLLAPLDGKLPAVAYEHARLAMYQGDCDTAAKKLAPESVQSLPDAGALLNIARGCMRAMAGTLTVKDDVHQVIVRFQDEADAPLASLIGETVDKQRAVLAKDLGVEMPRPSRVDVVRDQFSLAAMTGLPHENARKTGTVAIAKWGRVIMISPRAPQFGYGWRDTLAHELTHLALSRGTFDRAPLWLQEGVAKREETRWRPPLPVDDAISPDAIAAAGFAKELALPLDGLGPSIALLPSARQAMVAYAEVTSFVRYVAGDRAGEPNAPIDHDALPKLVKAYARGLDTNAALKDVTGKDLKAWDALWRPWVMGKRQKLPSSIGLDDPPAGPALEQAKLARKADREAHTALRLGQLLLARDHVKAARIKLDPLVAAHANDPVMTAFAGLARLLDGEPASARAFLEPKALLGDFGLWWAVRAQVLAATGAPVAEVGDAWALGAAHDPFLPDVSCGWADAKGLPGMDGWLEAAVKGLCAAARARGLPKLAQD
jgi:hypothetical protein